MSTNESEAPAAEAAVVFKKPARKANLRKRKIDDDAADEAVAGGPRCAHAAPTHPNR